MDGALKVTETQALQRVEPQALVTMALQQQADPAVLEKLLALQQAWEANEARKAYTAAMADFKRDAPAVLAKDASVKAGASRYKHATLGNIIREITTVLSKHGLSVAWFTKEGDPVAVGCRVTHVLGHHEETWLSAPPDKSGNKNPIQMIGSTVTYLQRYTLLALLGLATADQDDDGRGGSADRADGNPAPAKTQKSGGKPPAPDAATKVMIDHLRVCLNHASQMSGTKAAAIAKECDKALGEWARGERSPQWMATFYGNVKAGLKSLGWEEPAEWGEARKARQQARREQQAAQEELPCDPETGEVEPDVPEPPNMDDEESAAEREPGEEG